MNTNFTFKSYFEPIIHEYLISKNIEQIFPRQPSPHVEIKYSEDDCPKFSDNRDKIKEYKKNSLNDTVEDIPDYSKFQYLSSNLDIMSSPNEQILNLNSNVPIKIQKLYQLMPIFNLFFKYKNEENISKYTSFNDYLKYDKKCEIKTIELFYDIKIIITRIIRTIKCKNYLLDYSDLKILIYEQIEEKTNVNNLINININDEKIFNIWQNISIPVSKFFKFESHKSIKNLIFNMIKAECLIKSNNYIINNYSLSISKFNLCINHEWLKIDITTLMHDPTPGHRIVQEINNKLLSSLKNLYFGLFVDPNLTKEWENSKIQNTTFFKYSCDKDEQKKLLNQDTNFAHNSNNFNPLNIFKFLIIKLMNCSIITIELYIGCLINYLKAKVTSCNSDKKILFDLRKMDDLNDISKLIKINKNNNNNNNNNNNKNETNKGKLIILFPNYLTIIEMKNLFKLLNFYNIIICFIDNYLNIETTKFINEVIENIPKIPTIELNFHNVYKNYIKNHVYFNNYIDSYHFNNILISSYQDYILYTCETSNFNRRFTFLSMNHKSISLTLYEKSSIIEKNQLNEDLKIIKKNNNNGYGQINNNNIKKLEDILKKKENDYHFLKKNLKDNDNCIILQNFSAKFFMQLTILDDLNITKGGTYYINFICFKEKAVVLTTENLSQNNYNILFNNFKHIKIIKFI